MRNGRTPITALVLSMALFAPACAAPADAESSPTGSPMASPTAAPDAVSQRDLDGALFEAAERGQAAAAKEALDAGADPNGTDALGRDPLYLAIAQGDGSEKYAAVVRLLIDAGADVTAPNRDGALPRDFAVRLMYDAIVAEIDREP